MFVFIGLYSGTFFVICRSLTHPYAKPSECLQRVRNVSVVCPESVRVSAVCPECGRNVGATCRQRQKRAETLNGSMEEIACCRRTKPKEQTPSEPTATDCNGGRNSSPAGCGGPHEHESSACPRRTPRRPGRRESTNVQQRIHQEWVSGAGPKCGHATNRLSHSG